MEYSSIQKPQSTTVTLFLTMYLSKMRDRFFPKKTSRGNRQHRKYMTISLLMTFISGELSHGQSEPLNITEVVCDTSWGQALIT